MLENTTITGTVNADYLITADNYDLYEVAGTGIGDELLKLVDKRVKISGLIKGGKIKVIRVGSYEIIGE
jgi:hypothetical protein